VRKVAKSSARCVRTCTTSIGPVPQHAEATVLCIHNVIHEDCAGKLAYF
jgi:hypothetical protein